MSTFKTFQKYYQQRDLAAKEWKEKDGKVVGYFCDNVPEEFILAAGFFPYRISGDPNSDVDKADRFEQTLAFEYFVKTMLNMVLDGQYDFLDYLVIPHARASIHQLYPILAALKQDDPSQKFPSPFFLDNAHTTYLTSEIYNRERMLVFKKEMEKWAGQDISDKSLAKAITVGNENKRLLKEMARMRAADPPRISGIDALQILGSSMVMLKEEHNKLL
ncbi:MAG: 2-hydroxyacyl-CoA dehydratase [Deltaproteobacteria bacterium]|nr:2-hydroxyacyl-CoA dehydratase [Deltaproteobacteria bacterium]